ncbi:MAG: nucleotidyltransferase domain-containing protein [Candidatus Bathyarchaeia archaeon]
MPITTPREVRYDERRWNLLKRLRKRAVGIMAGVNRFGLSTILHGSVARGDVEEKSDIDIFVPYQVPSFKVEHALLGLGFEPLTREVVQATPHSVVKGYIALDEQTTVSFPITEMTTRERGFYRFGGEVTESDLRRNIRVPGVSKDLMLIEPTPSGHRETPVVRNESSVAKTLAVGVDVVKERVRVLTRRRQVGRTGVFVKYDVPPDETFEQVVRDLERSHRLLLWRRKK